MKILALETTDLSGSVAASDGSNVLLELELNPQQRSARSLAPAVKSLLQQVGWRPADVQLVAVTVGPGSFTGLRVGVTTAKTFAYAAGAEIVAIDTLETIAANVGEGGEGRGERAGGDCPDFRVNENGTVPFDAENRSFDAKIKASLAGASSPPVIELQVVLDAQRGEIVAGAFSLGEDGWFHPAGPQRLLPIEQWLADLRPGVAVTGPILKKLQSRIPPGIMVLEERFWHPRASQVALLAARDYAAGRRDDVWTLLPRYSRRSAAEEKMEGTKKP
ncbi:MAG: tRNA (adenosine(37)-N6)-threonylcarbamoyltransferase complex dimerization subunit type 1 TsaB [Pirellulales bacterium]|nr:tRNA (adenosine(37)-N6)-threonylcarbamoyltransferase complex dimerization subunit type 1 TsaB [Pirellulales bacterium]